MPTQEEKRECLRLNNLYKNRVAGQIAHNETPIDQTMIGVAIGQIEGKPPIDQSRISQILTGYSRLSVERAIVFSRIIGCEIKDFSPRIATLLAGVPVVDKQERVVVVEGTKKEISAAATQIARGKKLKTKKGARRLAYPGHCSLETRAFYVDEPQMEPELTVGSFAFVDPLESLETGDSVAIIRADRLTFARYMGGDYYEVSNPKFAEKPFTVPPECVVGPVIGIFLNKR
tara:strand:- start:785 stop:1477 length:693 start_codon:yes stop_codon:yes gene_type:complete